MAFLELPVNSDSKAYEFQLALEGVTYGFRFHYNVRSDLWSMSVRTEGGDDIVNGIPIFVDEPFLDRFKDPRLPPGTFFALDTSSQGLDPRAGDLGNRVKLIYSEIGTVFVL